VSGARLRLLDKADKEIMKLDRAVKGAIYDFQHKFRRNPNEPGLQFKQLTGHPRLYSARINRDYRALLLHAGGKDYILVAVKPRREVYENLDRYTYQINPVTGGIEFVDLVTAGQGLPPEREAGPRPLFADYPREVLLELGVTESLLDLIYKITTEDELLGLTSHAPQLTGDVLLALHDGKTPEEVLEQITRPVAATEKVDTDDYQAALARPATVTTDDIALQEVLEEGDFGRWRVFLHPTQRKIVEREYRGPARVSGGPGTGKTIVALHRVKHLLQRLGPGDGKDILLTTFNKNLAADLHQRLLALVGDQAIKRVHVVNIDKLASDVVAESEHGARRRRIDDAQAVEEWRHLLEEEGEQDRWDPEFLHAEWSEVILGQSITSRAEYFRARRVGRGRAISRADRARIWDLVTLFVMRLDDQGVWTHRQVAEHAARLEMERARKVREHQAAQAEAPLLQHESGMFYRHRYRHIVVDEAQDLSAAHWKMLRAMVPEGPNDIFLVGDTHQRIYGNYVSLGSLGINIRGRSAKLTLSYRTTHEILSAAVRLLGEEEWDDLDEGTDDLTGYRSVLRGPRPQFAGYPTWNAELDGIVERIRQLEGGSIAVCVPGRREVAEVEQRLAKEDILCCAIGSDGPKLIEAPVHIGTMHRFKGLEYRHMIIAGVSDGKVPSSRVLAYQKSDPLRFRREIKQARSLLFVASTRARDSVTISWNGRKSRFLP